ncbi:hypothetical protein BU25DRAFT_460701 [Macroventuria anomochaeta]|uniref:Uncharacterized protein n=1 Tax=Macroventuria anomochaeta TaxID=301207 RepID=A0ACB6RT23_9PLEO|nr:uncharacterized protein BU25DRAFT_460701 [Macroventuria anomochaeta]KAF2624857.1 hypothetical protein BU25DRAFT_460701 [Macroventuria anomochaeta]
MARKFTCLVEEHLVDKETRNWIIPDFTTTTDNDIAVASITMMATMQAYFESDWIKMRQRLDQLLQYGEQPTEWAKFLVPVFDWFNATFDRPDDEGLKSFWLTVCHADHGGSGQPDVFSGWKTAFAF